MINPKHVSFFGVWEDLHEYVQKQFPGVHVFTETAQETAPATDTEVLAVFVNSKVNKALLETMPNLKIVATMSTGFDHIDLAECAKRGIVVSSVPAYGENTVAEQTFALMLALTRHLYSNIGDIKNGKYSFGGERGVDLQNRVLGVIGTGRIGQHVLRTAQGFGMHIVAHDPFPKKELADKYGFEYLPLEDLLKKSDIVTLHSPLTKETTHLINQKNITLMKKGSYLINTARGGLIEPAAALEGLTSGRLAGLGLDVLEDEHAFEVGEKPSDAEKAKTYEINKQIIAHPNAVVTPHNAFNTTEALMRIIDTSIQNIQAFENGSPQNIVKA